MGQVTVVKGAYSGYCLWSIQTDVSNPKIRKIFSIRSGFSIPFLPLLHLVIFIDFEF